MIRFFLCLNVKSKKQVNQYSLFEGLSIIKGVVNKTGASPHCSHPKYLRFGKEKVAQCYKCKFCKRSFVKYIGTWMADIKKGKDRREKPVYATYC